LALDFPSALVSIRDQAHELIVRVLRFVDGLLGDMSKKDKKQLGELLGFVAGTIADEKYNSLSDSEKEAWNRDRLIHHGDFGAFVEDYGRKKKNPLVQGLGSGLMDSDRKDEPSWVYSQLLLSKPKKKKKTGRT
jgi:hypothetical protein